MKKNKRLSSKEKFELIKPIVNEGISKLGTGQEG